MDVTFLSVDGWKPETPDADTCSLLVNGHVMVDTGWQCVRNLMRVGAVPRAVDALFFTHMHQDHYVSLPQFLFFLLNGYQDAGSVTIYGPDYVEETVRQALAFAGRERHYAHCPAPKVVRLTDGDVISFPEMTVTCRASEHAVPGFMYRFTDKASGKSAVYTGDTRSFPGIAEFARDCEALIHEQSWGARIPEGSDNGCRHACGEAAGQNAAAAGAKSLYLVHTALANREAGRRAAQAFFSNAVCPNAGDVIRI